MPRNLKLNEIFLYTIHMDKTRQNCRPGISRRAQRLRASIAILLALAPLQKLAIDFEIYQWKSRFQNDKGLALSKMKFQASMLIIS